MGAGASSTSTTQTTQKPSPTPENAKAKPSDSAPPENKDAHSKEQPKTKISIPPAIVAPLAEPKSSVTAAQFSRLNAGPSSSTYDIPSAVSKVEKEEEEEEELDSKATEKDEEKIAYREVKESDVFELYTTDEGEQYVVYFKENGRRYYIDWDKEEWIRFPDSWLRKGRFEYYENPAAIGLTSTVPGTAIPSSRGKSVESEAESAPVATETDDGRSGVFLHPTKGKLFTYVFEKRRNVAYVFDNESGGWLKMPISWEKNVSYVKTMIQHIQDAVPQWKDVRSIVAALRASNYRTDDCIANYVALQDDGALDDWPEDDSSLRNRVKQLGSDLDKKTSQVASLTDANKKLKQRVNQMEDTVEDLKDRLAEMKRERDDALQRAAQQAAAIEKTQRDAETKRQTTHRVDPARVIVVCTAVRSVKTSLLSLRQNAAKNFDAIGSLVKTAVKKAKSVGGMAKRVQAEVEELRHLYRKECVQRKLLYNQLQELRGNIRVFCRCRPDDRAEGVLEFPREGEIVAYTPQGAKKTFEFDRVYDPNTRQEEIFEDTKPTITSCVDGYNVCIIAYGQTGSGKTYTMMGPPENSGVNIRSIEELLRVTEERKQIKFSLMVSILEVYNETILDLLDSGSGATKLHVQASGQGVSVPGLTEIEVKTLADVRKVMERGDRNRSTAQTAMNSTSSRSHLILSVSLTGVDAVSKAVTRGKLMLVDLAGSERISRSEAKGQRLVEAAAINKSLTSLGQVFTALRTNALHIPYRNSKLTHLLQPALGGDSKACMFVNVSPTQVNIAETLCTIQFGQSARQVELGPAQRHVTKAAAGNK